MTIGAFVALYILFVLTGFIPINVDYVPPPVDDRVRIFIRTNEIHTDFVVPVNDEATGIDWRPLFPADRFTKRDVTRDKYVAIGWGAQKFFIETPTWGDLTLYNFCRAMFWPSPSVMHVEYMPNPQPGPNMREVWITRENYRVLSEHLRSSCGEKDESGAVQTITELTYGKSDRFFASDGTYHLFNTCNQWTGRGLAKIGVPTGLWTPLKEHVLWRLPEMPHENAMQP